MSNLTVMRTITLRDVAPQLRQLADAIERGERGDVHGCAVVLDAAGLDVFYWGDGEAAPNCHLLLHAGAAKMTAAVVEAKG